MNLLLKSTGLPAAPVRPVVRLAAGTLFRAMSEVEPERAYRDLNGFAVVVNIVRFEQVGLGVPMDSPLEPGRVGHRKKDRFLTIDVNYNEINMVFERVERDRPGGRTLATSRDYLDTLANQIEVAVERLVAWCDRKDAWAERAHFADAWNAALAAIRQGAFSRPYEFAATSDLRDALDTTWRLVEATEPEDERFETLAEAYFLLRETGWKDAEYEADMTAEATRFGQPAQVSNASQNIATARSPDARNGYSFA